MHLTENEKIVLNAGCKSNYENFCVGRTWVFDVIDCSKLDAKVARGVISSLVKKELVEVCDYDDETEIYATKAGIEICEDLGFETAE